MAKPVKYEPEHCQKLLDHCKNGFEVQTFGATIGVSRATIYNWMTRYPEFKQAHEMGISYLRMRATQRLIDFAEGRMDKGASVIAAIYLAKVYGVRDDKPLIYDGENVQEIETTKKIKSAFTIEQIEESLKPDIEAEVKQIDTKKEVNT